MNTPYGDERVKALQRRAMLAERLLVDLGRATAVDVAAGMVVQALVRVAGVEHAELLAHAEDPTTDDEPPVVVLARAGEPPAPTGDDPVDRHRAVDVGRGLELIVTGDGLAPIAVDRSLDALGTIFDRINGEATLLREARTDVLTGLLNRRAINERIESEVARVGRTGVPLSLLVLDLDGFKVVNDRLGHAAGDDALRATADAMRRVARTADDAGRLGGDEFALLLPGATGVGAAAVAVRLRDELATLDPPIAASIGITTVDSLPLPTVREVLEEADRAMYRAKRDAGVTILHARDPIDVTDPVTET